MFLEAGVNFVVLFWVVVDWWLVCVVWDCVVFCCSGLGLRVRR